MTAGGFLKGAPNFRAVRPYPAAGGRHLRENIIFRSGELSRLNDADLAALAGLNLQLVCDLRSAQERADYVSRWPDGSRHRHIDLPDREQTNASPDKLFSLIARDPTQAGGIAAMRRLYRHKPAAFAANLKYLFSAILAGDALPMLVHCHAGKDRTGFIVAMLLSAAGVARTDVLDDYELTARFFVAETQMPGMQAWARAAYGRDLPDEAALPLIEARRDYLAASFAEIDEQFGGVEGYLKDAVGLTPADIAAFQALVLA